MPAPETTHKALWPSTNNWTIRSLHAPATAVSQPAPGHKCRIRAERSAECELYLSESQIKLTLNIK
eukprot:scaffold429026_cov20-Prasinocladus_malaysianus.AAC.1